MPEQTGSPENLNRIFTDIENRPEKQRQRVDYLVVCGQGPVQEKGEKIKASEAPAPGRGPEANSWMKFIAYSAGEIYKQGLCGKIVLTGGKTGGEGFPSEAELMKEELIKRYKVPEDSIIIEDKATNTLQNFALSINGIDSAITDQTSFGVLAADFHTERVALLAKMFGLNPKELYSAEKTLLSYWGASGDKSLSEGSKKFLLARVIPEEAKRLGLFAKELGVKGQETKDVGIRGNEEKRYSANLVEVPAYWLGYVGLLDNENRIRRILVGAENDNPGVLTEIGVDLNDNIESIREALQPYTTMLNQGGKREMEYENIAQTGNVPKELMIKIRLKIPPGAPVIRSIYY